MKHVIIVDSNGVELQRHPLNGDDRYNETLTYGCMITAESQSMDHPEDPRKSSVVDDEAES